MKEIIVKVLNILQKKEKQQMLSLILFDVLISIADIAFLVVFLFVIDFYSQTASAKHTIPFAKEIFKAWPLLLISVFLLLFAAKNYLAVKVSQKHSDFIYDVASRISKEKLRFYFSRSFHEYVKIDSSDHVRAIQHDPIQFAHYVLRGIKDLVCQVILILVALITIIIFNPILFLLLFFILVPPVILFSITMKRKLNVIRNSGKITHQKMGQYLNEALQSFVECKVYNKQDFFFNRYEKYLLQLNNIQAEQQTFQAIPSRLIEVFAIMGLCTMIGINHYLTDGSSLKLITVGAFMAAAYKIIPGIVKILNNLGFIRSFSYTLDSLTTPHIVNSSVKNDHSTIDAIQFTDLSFSYNGLPVIKNLSFKINKSDLVGIAGQSGKGKTTILNLLLGFLNPDEGEILINSCPSNPGLLKNYRNRISYVKQQPFFIHDSVLRNITLQEEGFNNVKLSEALRLSGADKVIENLDEGLNTMIVENGKNLSGGQRQRIVFARALYKEFDLLLLDEPFSELDEESEYKLMQNLGDIAESGKIVVLITHNTSSLSMCTKQIVLEEHFKAATSQNNIA